MTHGGKHRLHPLRCVTGMPEDSKKAQNVLSHAEVVEPSCVWTAELRPADLRLCLPHEPSLSLKGLSFG